MKGTHSTADKQPERPGTQNMREIFKRYRKMSPHEIDFDESILDSQYLSTAAETEVMYVIPGSQRKKVFREFVHQEVCGDMEDLEDVPTYSHRAFPGLLIAPAILSPLVQEQLISKLLHRDLSDPKHQTNLHLFYDVPYPIALKSKLLEPDSAEATPDTAASFFAYSPSSSTVFTPKDPTLHRSLSITKVMQKSLRWITLGGQYDWTRKIYPDEEPPAFPQDIGALLEGLFNQTKPEAAIVNLYSPGDTLSLHRDVSEDCDAGLLSISLGCDALFIVGLGNEETATDTLVVRLRSGDAVYMANEARYAYHAVPKILPNTCPAYLSSWPAKSGGLGEYEEWRGWMSNKRINLNVRQMHD